MVDVSPQRPPSAIHVDLDGASAIFPVHGRRYDHATDPLFETGIRNALRVLERADVRATFFLIAEDLDDPRKRELVREICAAGHEIASHTMTHRKLTALDASEKRREIIDSRARISDVLGVAVSGFRAPQFAVDRETLELLDEAGYSYDSSLFPGAASARRLGFEHLPDRPHRPLPGSLLTELPMPGHAPLPFPFHPSYSLMLGLWYFRAGINLFARRQAPLVLLFHLTDFADPLPQSYLPSRRLKYYTLSHLDAATKTRRCSEIIEHVRERFSIVTTQRYLTSSLS